jgi:serine/threonine-protein phosphatase 2B catalytic subunit
MESLPDPLEDRVLKDILPPPQKCLSRSKLFPERSNEIIFISIGTIPDWKLLKDHLYREGKLEKGDLLDLINIFINISKTEPNIVKIQDPLTVVGDIHGQFYDLIKVLEVGGDPQNTKYLFLGDYVDRGSFSIECIILLYAIKVT